MTVKYERIKFNKASEAVAFIEDGGELFQMDCGHAIPVNMPAAISNYKAIGPNALYRSVKPDWRDKLDGSVKNGVLCYCAGAEVFVGLVKSYDSDDCDYCVDGYGWVDDATPLTKAEIKQLMENAPC